MKTLYIECNMGAAGDMLMAALLELSPDKTAFLEKINALGLKGVKVSAEPSVKCGLLGTHVSVVIEKGTERIEETSVDVDPSMLSSGTERRQDHHARHHDNEHDHPQDENHAHHHDNEHPHQQDNNPAHQHNHDDHQEANAHQHDDDRNQHEARAHQHNHDDPSSGGSSFQGIEATLSKLSLPDGVRRNVLAIYRLLAEAEAHAHGSTVTEAHFHEVGALDAVADIAGVCLLMDELHADRIVVSPVHVGSGFVRCAHGVLPVPAPATAYLLRGAPSYGGNIKGELCTPTGAAILKHFASEFGPMPQMKVEKIGCGMGKKDFEAANCVRAFLGESGGYPGGPNGGAVELRCNVDDMTGEELGFACQTLMREGAMDVFTMTVDMKKDRPGVMLTCLCEEDRADFFAALMLKHTTSFGVRKAVYSRYTLDREIQELRTPLGITRIKKGFGYGVNKFKFEYEDLASLAREKNVSVQEMRRLISAYLEDGERNRED